MRGNGRLALTVGMLGLMAVAGWAQVPRPQPPAQSVAQGRLCLHDGPETPAERQRREEALAAVRLTDRVVDMARGFQRFRSSPAAYPAWEDLAATGAQLGRMDGGPMGRLARKIEWGSAEPLPGWRVHYVADRNGYALSMTDSLDACGWTYFGDERGIVAQGHVLDAPEGVVPVESK